MWGVEDSNLRKHKLADLQSDPFGHSGNSPKRFHFIQKSCQKCRFSKMSCKGMFFFLNCKKLAQKIIDSKSIVDSQ